MKAEGTVGAPTCLHTYDLANIEQYSSDSAAFVIVCPVSEVAPKRINSSREVALGNAVVARTRRWRPQVYGRINNNKSKLLGRGELTRRPGARKRSVLEGYAIT
jgi:hypothetical protein